MNQIALIAPPTPTLCTVTFTVYGEPIPCGRPRSSIGNRSDGSSFVRVYADPKSDKYEEVIGNVARGAVSFVQGWRADWAFYSVAMRVYQAVDRGDGDNFEKALWDGCKGILWNNDGRIKRWSGQILEDFDKPRMEVLARMVGQHSLEDHKKNRVKLLAARRRRSS